MLYYIILYYIILCYVILYKIVTKRFELSQGHPQAVRSHKTQNPNCKHHLKLRLLPNACQQILEFQKQRVNI